MGGLLNSEAQTLDTEINNLAVLDPELASRAEKLRCAASASAMKAMSSVRRYRNEDGAASKCSAGSFVPRSRLTAGSAAEDRSASNVPPPKSDAQKSRDASEPLFAKKKPTSGKEHRKRDLSPPSNEDDSSGVEEDDGLSSEDAEGYDRERRQYNEDRWRWQENAQRNPPRDGWGDDPEEPPGGGGGGAGQGDGGGQPPPPPRGDGDQPRGQHRQVGIIDGDATGAAIDGVLSALAKRFEKPSRPPPPPIPVFKDS